MGRIRKSIQENVASDDIVKKLSDTEFVLCAKEDTELTLGRIKVETGYTINAGKKRNYNKFNRQYLQRFEGE